MLLLDCFNVCPCDDCESKRIQRELDRRKIWKEMSTEKKLKEFRTQCWWLPDATGLSQLEQLEYVEKQYINKWRKRKHMWIEFRKHLNSSFVPYSVLPGENERGSYLNCFSSVKKDGPFYVIILAGWVGIPILVRAKTREHLCLQSPKLVGGKPLGHG